MATGQYEKINVRGVDFLNVTLDEAAALGRGMLSGDRLYAVFTPNAEIVQMCVEQPSYYALYNSADMVLPDGAGVVKAAKILGTPLKGKAAGVELGEKMLEYCAQSGGWGIFSRRKARGGGRGSAPDDREISGTVRLRYKRRVFSEVGRRK